MMPPFVQSPASTTGRPGRFRHGLVNVTIWEDGPSDFGVTFGARADVGQCATEHEARAAAVVFLRQLAADATHAARMIERGGPV